MLFQIKRRALVIYSPRALQFSLASAPAKELSWQLEKLWLFVTGALNWKQTDMFGSPYHNDEAKWDK
jgi:hypothetical protein